MQKVVVCLLFHSRTVTGMTIGLYLVGIFIIIIICISSDSIFTFHSVIEISSA